MSDRTLRALAEQLVDEDTSVKLGARGAALWGLIFDCLNSDDGEMRQRGVRHMARAYEGLIAELERQLDEERRRPWWRRRRGKR
jgi:hypothetical protein